MNKGIINAPTNPETTRMMELIDGASGHRGVIRCGELEQSVKRSLERDSTAFNRDLFYSVLAAMNQKGKIGYFGVPNDNTQIQNHPEPVWYVE